MTARRRPSALIALLAGAVFLPAALLAGCGNDAEPRSADVEDVRLIREADGTQVIQGALVNTADRRIRGARVSLALYEGEGAANGEVADSISFEVTDIGPGERKVFRQVLDTPHTLSGVRVSRIVLF